MSFQISDLGNCENDSFLARRNRNGVPEISGFEYPNNVQIGTKIENSDGIGLWNHWNPSSGMKEAPGDEVSTIKCMEAGQKGKNPPIQFSGSSYAKMV